MRQVTVKVMTPPVIKKVMVHGMQYRMGEYETPRTFTVGGVINGEKVTSIAEQGSNYKIWGDKQLLAEIVGCPVVVEYEIEGVAQ